MGDFCGRAQSHILITQVFWLAPNWLSSRNMSYNYVTKLPLIYSSQLRIWIIASSDNIDSDI